MSADSSNQSPKPSKPRLTDTAAGKILAGLLILFYASLVTVASGGEWYMLFLPACLLIPVLLLFIYCLVRGYKIPSPGLMGWLALGVGGGYFFLRAWYSPWYYESLADMQLIVTAIVMFTVGIYAGASKSDKSVLPWVAAALGSLNVALLIWQCLSGDSSSWFRPEYTLAGREYFNVGLFGYKNFSGHFFCISGFFIATWNLVKEKKCWPAVLGGLAIALFSLCCESEAAYLNLTVGIILCFFVYTVGVFQQSGKFYTSAILFIILFFAVMSYVLADLFQGGTALNELFAIVLFGTRLTLAKLAWNYADMEPVFGHGSRMFTNLATESFQGSNYPNFVHHEYAQAACDYGYLGLLIMLAILGVCLFLGGRGVMRLAREHSNCNKLAAPALCVLVMACVHAYGEFIWHNPALLGASALCAGLICTAGAEKIKVSHVMGRWIQVGVAGLICGLTVCYASKTYPVWQASMQAVPASSAAVLPMLDCATTHSPESELVNHQVQHELTMRPYPDAERLKRLEDLVAEANAVSPGCHALVPLMGRIYNRQGRFAEAEKVLRPYTDIHSFFDGMHAWKTVYMNNLFDWAMSINRQDPAKALSMLREVERIGLAMRDNWYYYGALDPKNRKQYWAYLRKVKMTIRIMESRVQTPDDSWMN